MHDRPPSSLPSESACSSWGHSADSCRKDSAPAEKGSIISLWQETTVQLWRGQLACSQLEQWEQQQMLPIPGMLRAAALANGRRSFSLWRRPGSHASSPGGLGCWSCYERSIIRANQGIKGPQKSSHQPPQMAGVSPPLPPGPEVARTSSALNQRFKELEKCYQMVKSKTSRVDRCGFESQYWHLLTIVLGKIVNFSKPQFPCL